MPSEELVAWEANAGEGVPPEVLMLARALDLDSSIDESGVNTATLEIMAQILRASSEEEVFAAANAGAVSAKDFVGIPFKFKLSDLQWKRSAAVFRENGAFPYYMLARATNLSDGSEFVMTCGAPSVCAVVYRLGQLDSFGTDGETALAFMLEAKPVSSGFSVLLIKPFTLVNEKTAKK